MNLVEREIKNINEKIVSKQTLINVIKKENPNYKESSIRWTIYKLIKQGVITQLGNNTYYNGKLKSYRSNSESSLIKDIKLVLSKTFSNISYVIYETKILNEWVNHQISRNIIFVEVEKFFMKDVFRVVQKNYSNTLFNPKANDYYMYQGDLVIISGLVTQAPIDNDSKSIKLEKLIVDFYTKDLINDFITDEEKEEVIHDMFKTYKINKKTILAYAKRRNNYDKVSNVLEIIKN